MQQFGAKCETTLKLNSISELWNDVCAIFVHDARFQTGIPVWFITKFNYLHQSASSITV